MKYTTIAFCLILNLLTVKNSSSAELISRETKVEALGVAIKVAKVLSYGALPFTLLTGCVNVGKESDECPVFFNEELDNDSYLNATKITNLKRYCSPKAVNYPIKNYEDPSVDLPAKCVEALRASINWDSSAEGSLSDTEKNLKNIFIKGVWASLFIPRATPSLFTYGGRAYSCNTLEKKFLGAEDFETSGFDINKWNNGDYIQKRLLNILLGSGIKVGFKSSEVCSNGVMYYSESDNNVYICKANEEVTENYNASKIGSIIAHEIRHSSQIFSDGYTHVDCEFGEEACDRGEYGGYGVNVLYADQLNAGSKFLLEKITVPEARANLITNLHDYSRTITCGFVPAIKDADNVLYDEIQEADFCNVFNTDTVDTFLIENYGYSSSTLAE